MSKARTGLYDKSKASGGMYLYVPPVFLDVVSLLFKTLLEVLDSPKSANCKIKRKKINMKATFKLYINSYI